MSWIKRNLLFVLGSAVALALMVGAGVFNYSRWKLNADDRDKFNAQYAELERLNNANPNPGSEKVNNIAAANDQRLQLQQFLTNACKYFERIPAIPNSTNVTSEEFAAALRQTVVQLLRDAETASVILPPKNPTTGAPYYFSFEAERPLVKFAPGSLQPLAVQLGEIKAICDVLFQARVNSLDNIRRERDSADDQGGSQSDYLDLKSTTNEMAVLTPYEITFRCFSQESAAVLEGFASSAKGFIVKKINVEPAPASIGPGAAASGSAPATETATPSYGPRRPPASRQAVTDSRRCSMNDN